MKRFIDLGFLRRQFILSRIACSRAASRCLARLMIFDDSLF